MSPSKAVHPDGGGSAGNGAAKPPLRAGCKDGGLPPPPLLPPPGAEAPKKSGTAGRGDRGLRGTAIARHRNRQQTLTSQMRWS